MNARDSQLTGRLRLAHLQERTEARGEEMEIERQRFARLADPGSRPRVVSAFNLFQTPEPLAARMAALTRPGRTLEPSAGLGRLYRAMRQLDTGSPITLVEQAADCAAELYREIERDEQARLIQADFLACDAARLGGLFDAILMNPPFKMGRDIKHIKHALTLLAPGGRLVALCAAGPRQREHLQPLANEWHDLPPGSFKSEGTNVAAAMIVIDR